MRCDLHVYTKRSGMCTVPLLRRVCRESYNEPRAVYEKLKRLGMDLVTLTDHDSIDAAHHIFSGLTGRRDPADFELFENGFPALETRNGQMLALANESAAVMADNPGKIEAGGSEAHAMASVGCAWTVVPRARSKQEVLDGLRRGEGKVRGAAVSYWKLTRDVLSIGGQMLRHDQWTLPLAPLCLLIPPAIAGNSVRESFLARWWMREYRRSRAARFVDAAVESIA